MYIHVPVTGEGQRPLRICSTLASHIHLTHNIASLISGFISFFFLFYLFIMEKEIGFLGSGSNAESRFLTPIHLYICEPY